MLGQATLLSCRWPLSMQYLLGNGGWLGHRFPHSTATVSAWCFAQPNRLNKQASSGWNPSSSSGESTECGHTTIDLVDDVAGLLGRWLLFHRVLRSREEDTWKHSERRCRALKDSMDTELPMSLTSCINTPRNQCFCHSLGTAQIKSEKLNGI